MKRPSLLDPSFRYTPSVATDISRTFARIRREQAAAAKAPSVHQADRDGNARVVAIMAERRGK